ncbi:MAG: isochorismatase family protein, partial [Terriglobus sp.]
MDSMAGITANRQPIRIRIVARFRIAHSREKIKTAKVVQVIRRIIGIMANTALLVIDVQQDFLPNGLLAVPKGNEVIPIINRLGQSFPEIAITQDWHPAGHISFASTHGKAPFTDTVEATYGTQALWPDHTIQETPGAELSPELHLPHAGLILRKGFRR